MSFHETFVQHTLNPKLIPAALPDAYHPEEGVEVSKGTVLGFVRSSASRATEGEGMSSQLRV